MSFSFEYPAVLLLGIILMFIVSRRSTDALTVSAPLGAPGAPAFKNTHGILFFMRLLHLLEYAGIASITIALAGPCREYTQPVWRTRGADILFVLDISPSMSALDMEGDSRFGLARSLIRDLALRRPTDALGLVCVGTDAALLVPPTIDRNTFLSRLDSLRIGELGDGTALGTGLGLASLHLNTSRARRKVIVLITDGENNAGAIPPEAAAATIPDQGISFWVIGIGRTGEVPIDYVDPDTNTRRTGLFYSRYAADQLKALSAAGAGTYLEAHTASAFTAAFSRIDDTETVITRQATITKTISYHAVFLSIGASLILLVHLLVG
jgi:Ca-activated chloride channel family protein